MSSQTEGILLNLTSAGSSSQTQYGLEMLYNAGYTGSSPVSAILALNQVAGTSTDYITGGNSALHGSSNSTTTGSNVGVRAAASNGNISLGVIGAAVATKNGATNIGVMGLSSNGGTTPIRVGGYFGFNTAAPTLVDSALIVDNFTVAAPIAIFWTMVLRL